MSTRSKRPRLTLSTLALAGIAGIGGIILVAVFAYILAIAPLSFDSRLWWMGLTSGVFAVGFYVIYAATHERRIVRPLTAAFFLVSVGSFYASIYANSDPPSTKLFWTLALSILVAIPLTGVYVMARQAEANAMRRAERKVSP